VPTADAIASGVVGNATTDGPALFLYSRLFNANGHAVAFRKPRLIFFRPWMRPRFARQIELAEGGRGNLSSTKSSSSKSFMKGAST
jgi:hypothetical protein